MSGTLVAIGGAEAKVRRRTVLRAFVAAAGGPGCRIAVVPSASSLGPEVVEVYRSVFTALGAAEVVELRPTSRAAAARRSPPPTNGGRWSAAPRPAPASWPST